MDVSAARFKAECLQLMDQVEKTRKPIVITKRGRPVAQLGPVPAEWDSLFGYMRSTMRIVGDVTAPIDVEWSALSGDEDRFYEPVSRKRARKR